MWRKIANRGMGLLDLLFPRRCVVCKRELLLFERHLCTACMAELPLTFFWNYRDNPAEIAFAGRVKIERVFSLFYYNGPYKQILYSLKYRSNVALARFMGHLLGEKIKEAQEVFDYIIPVPLHYLKKWKRGYNQSYIIALGIRDAIGGGRLKKHIIKRAKYTNTQTKKEKIARWINVCNAFSLAHNSTRKIEKYGQIFKDKNVLVVDDVLTTGATLDACCSLLSPFGCKITIATLAYVE